VPESVVPAKERAEAETGRRRSSWRWPKLCSRA
jgi:hypothetical protein